jgi:hypothetical protein
MSSINILWHPYSGDFFCQRAIAARSAISFRRSGVRALALAFPPLAPPKRPRATAAGFLRLPESTSPVASTTTRWAVWFTSSDFFLERLGIGSKLIAR